MKSFRWPTELRGTTALYVATLGGVAVLSLGGQFLVQWQLRTQANDSRTINVAGRQRMLSQQIAKGALELSTAADSSRQAVRLQEIRTAAAEWEQAGSFLRTAKDSPPHVQRMFAALDERYLPLRDAVRALIEPPAPAPDHRGLRQRRADCVQTILRHEGAFLLGMDAIVNEYDRLAAERVAALQRLELILLGTTLVVLLAEGLFVFRPAMQRIRRHVDDLRRGSEELQIARTAAEAASRAKSEFLSHLSHEVRTPMNAIVGLTEVSLHEDMSSKQRKRLEAVNDCAGVLLELLNNSLDLAKIESGRLDLERRPFDVHELCRSLHDSYAEAAAEKGVTLRVSIADDVPAEVSGDLLRLRQVLANLLSNAVKFTAEGKIELRLTVDRTSDDHVRLRFAVEDTGTGIAPEKQAVVFEPFVQADSSTTRRFGGTGLGLTIAAQLVRSMQGEMTLRSRQDVGSTFSFEATFSLVAATNRPALGSNDEPAKSVSKDRRRSLRILAAEDSPAGRLLLATLLESAGHDLLSVETGAQAVRAFAAGTWDCVLLDVQMPDTDGVEATRAMREIERRRAAVSPTPIVAVTAYATPEDRRRCLAAGMTEHLSKPLRSRALSELLARLTDRTPPLDGLLKGPPPCSGNGSLEHLDSDAAIALLDGDRELYRQLAELFLAESPRSVEELRRDVLNRDSTKIELLAHRLQGQLAALGAFPTAATARELELSAHSPAAAEAFVNFHAAWFEVHAKLAQPPDI